MHASNWKKKPIEVLKRLKIILSTNQNIKSLYVLDEEN